MDVERLRALISMVQDADNPFDHIADYEKRSFLTALLHLGNKTKALSVAGLPSMALRRKDWVNDDEFQEAAEFALMAGLEARLDEAEEEARRRGVDGEIEYQYTRDGVPIRHPIECECGHVIQGHQRIPREDGDFRPHRRGNCTVPDCGCEEFIGRPDYKKKYSDRLLLAYLEAHSPKWVKKSNVSVSGVLVGMSMEDIQALLSKAPDDVVSRITDGGESPQVVLAEWLEVIGGDAKKLIAPPDPNEIVVDNDSDDGGVEL